MAYQIPAVFRQANQLQMTSPVLQSHRMFDLVNEHLIYFECKVTNGSLLPTPLPFGVFAEIVNRENSHQSILQVWVANGYYDNSPVFRQQVKLVNNYNKYICKAREVTEIVAQGTEPLPGVDVWKSEVTPFDEVHDVRNTVYVLETKVVSRGEYDPQLGVSHTVTEELVSASVAEDHAQFPSGLLEVSLDVSYDFIEFDELSCGWYLKTTERMLLAETLTLHGTQNHSFPAVLQGGPAFQFLNGEHKDPADPLYGETYVTSVLSDIRLKESYSGPCVATVLRGWSNSPPTKEIPTQMVTDSLQYNGIFVNFSIPDCLHYSIYEYENVGSNHPVLVDNQFRWAQFPATARTVWPTTVVLPQFAQPYKGGYLLETITIDSPL
jgi:hypothetical protein